MSSALRRSAFRGSALFLLMVAAATCRAPEPARQAPPNIVLITIDTLRADRLRRGFTPAIDALADRGVRFDTARSAVPLTLPSHVTIMTGQSPPATGVRENGVVFTPTPATPTLAHALGGAGYKTGGFVGAYVLDRRFGLADGFDAFDDRIKRDVDAGERLEAERTGRAVIDAVLPWLQQTATPFFLWVHLYDPHAPYEPPADFQAKAGGNPYDGEVAFADAQVARLLEALGSRGLTSSTVIALAGDHGEGLGEHGEQTHGMLAYDSTLRVPLMIAGPSIAPRVVSSPVSLIDIAPTLLGLAGVTPPARMSGTDLRAAGKGERDVYAETQYPRAAGWHPLSALAGERWKLIVSSENELFDLASDPAEQHNVASDHAGVVQGMTAKLSPLTTATASATAAAPADAAERLRALGYVSGSPSASRDSSGAPNPARVIAAWATFETALSQVNAGKPREALPALQNLAARFPDAAVFQTTYGRALKDAGRAAEAVAVYKKAASRIQDASLFHDLAVAARAAGNASEAARAEQAALALDGNNASAVNGLGLLHAEAGRAKEAAQSFERATTLDPSNPSYWTNLGNARRELGDLAGAEAAYKRAVAADPDYGDAANGLGALLVQQQRPAEAIALFERAIKQSPDSFEARLNLGIALQETGQRDRAAEVYKEILAKAPAKYARERDAAKALLSQIAK